MYHQMGKLSITIFLLILTLAPNPGAAQLRKNYYANVCPNVESIVRTAVNKKFQQTFVTIPATLRLFFHDCFVQGCDASVIIGSTPTNQAETAHPDNLSLAGDGFDTVIQAKKALDAIPQCKNKVSCADILTMAARDVVSLAGGPSYTVELGRLDGLKSTAASVNGNLPGPGLKLAQLNTMFAKHGLTQKDMIALSAAHTLGFAHCSKVANRLYSFNSVNRQDPSLNATYAKELKAMCPQNVDPRIAINMDPSTPRKFDNQYFKNLQQKKGLFTSDQTLFDDLASRQTVNDWAKDAAAFNLNFIAAMTKLGRVGVKTGSQGNIRRDCSVFN